MSNRYLLIAGVAILSLSITSCGSGTSAMFRGDPAHSGVIGGSGPKTLDALKWKFTTPDKVYASPVASDKEVYQGCNDGYLYAVNAETGLLNWKFRGTTACMRLMPKRTVQDGNSRPGGLSHRRLLL